MSASVLYFEQWNKYVYTYKKVSDQTMRIFPCSVFDKVPGRNIFTYERTANKTVFPSCHSSTAQKLFTIHCANQF